MINNDDQIITLLTEIRDLLRPKPRAKPQHQVRAEMMVAFESSFWSVYPRKVGRAAAEDAWAKLAPDTDLQRTILEAVKAQSRSEAWRKDNGTFIPYPASWLNGRRWQDQIKVEIAQVQPKAMQQVERIPDGVPPDPATAAKLARLFGKDMSFTGGGS